MKPKFVFPIFILLFCIMMCLLISQLKFNNKVLDMLSETFTSSRLPKIFAITPTYERLVQKADLTRAANTFRQVPSFHWIVVEDAVNKTKLVHNFLRHSGIDYTHLCVKTPKGIKSRGALQRNLGLSWLRDRFIPRKASRGVVYFADDDNTYSLELFEEMRYTKKVSVWPVGLAGGLNYESIKVNNASKVIGWSVKFAPVRPFAIDMAGFAVNLDLILEKPKAIFHLDARGGFLESSILIDLVRINDLEPKADNCTKVLVWHTRTQKPSIKNSKNITNQNLEV